MSFSRRRLLFGATGLGVAAARNAFTQQVLAPARSQSDVVLVPSNLPSGVARAVERARDANQAEGNEFTPHRFILNASTNQQTGQPFRLSAAVMRTGRGDRFHGPLSFHSSDPNAVLPETYGFNEKDDRLESHLFDVTLRSQGEHTVTARDEISGREWTSNVIMASTKEPSYKLYFGDIHIHSHWSFDGRESPDYNYQYARDAMNLDFACLTEHDPTDYIWDRIKAKARELYEPGRFATMSAYEWTGSKLGEGHKNVYYRDWEGPILRSNWFANRAGTTSAADLWNKLRKAGKSGPDAMTIPHHPAARSFPVPWEHYDPEFQRCVEIYSTWGNSEAPGGPRQIGSGSLPGHFAQDALGLGHKIGFVGASDSHSGRPGYPAHSRAYYESDYKHWKPTIYTGGFTGVYTSELTREAIFDAIRDRRCYATTGQRIIVDFRINGEWMGRELKSREAPFVSVKVTGTAPIDSVTVVKNNQDYLRMDGDGSNHVAFEYEKTDPPKETDYYYVRVIQRDYEMAWASPIWVTRP